MQCQKSGLILPKSFIDEKIALKEVIDKIVDETVYGHQHIKQNYFLTLHMKFNKYLDNQFEISEPKITLKIPPFRSNTLVFWVSNIKGICELLWMVVRDNFGKLKVEFNKEGVAFLKAKGAMPS